MKKTTFLILFLLGIFLITQPTKLLGQERATTTYTMTICSSSNGNTNVQWTSTSQTSLSYNNVSWSTSVTGTTSMTANTTYAQIGSKNNPATQVTISTTAFAGKKITATSLTGFCMTNEGPALTITAGSTNILSNVALVKTTSTTYSTPNNLTPVVLGASSNNALTFTINSNASAAICISQISVTFVEPHTITFNGNGGTYNSESSYTQTVFDGEATNLTSNQFTYADHNFLGWKDANDNDYTNGQSVALTADLALTAQWEAIGTDPYITAADVNVEYNAPSSSINYTVNNFQSGTMTASTTADWITIGTITGPDATEHTGTVPFTMEANTGAQRVATLTLSYDYGGNEPATKEVNVTQAIAQCTVEYDKNDSGASGTMSDNDSPYNYGSTVTVLDNGFTAPTGMVFDHWSTASNGGTTYYPDNTFNITGNVTLYAQWRSLYTYTLVTSTDQIIPGKHYIIANSKTAGKTYYAMGGQNGSYRDAIPVEVVVQPINANENHVYICETENVSEIIVCGTDTDGFYSIFDANDSKFLQAPTTSGNGNNLNENATIDNEKGRWSISFGNNDKNAIFEANHTGKYIIRYNYNSGTNPRFSCYGANNTQDDVFLYLKDGDNDGAIYSATTLSKNGTYTNLTIVKTVVNENPVVNGSITVPDEKTLTVTGTLTNKGDVANLVINDGGQLITNNAVQATVQKDIAAWNTGTTGGWHFVASPINVDNLNPTSVTGMISDNLGGDATPTTATYDLYKLNNTTWKNYRADAFNLANGLGYLYASKDGATLQFSGAIKAYDASSTIPVSEGWNLVGNPYTFAAYPNQSYYTINDANNGITAQTATSSAAVNPCTGIIIKATADGSVKFLNEVPDGLGNPSDIQMTLSHTVATRGGSNDETIDNAIVSFNEGTELEKFYFGNLSANIYIPQNQKEFAIVSANAQGEMPVNFRANENGQYTLKVNLENVEMNYLHLIDNMTGADVDLLVNPSYTFDARTTDYASRFRLLFSANGVEENDNDIESENFAFINNGEIIINGTGTVQVIDALGRILLTQEVTPNSSLPTPNYSGVYVLRLVGEKVKTQKIVVK